MPLPGRRTWLVEDRPGSGDDILWKQERKGHQREAGSTNISVSLYKLLNRWLMLSPVATWSNAFVESAGRHEEAASQVTPLSDF